MFQTEANRATLWQADQSLLMHASIFMPPTHSSCSLTVTAAGLRNARREKKHEK
jgi:hypothetical protein